MAHQYENIPGLNPFFGAVITFLTLILGIAAPTLNVMLHYHIPPMIIEFFQCVAYAGTGTVGAITGYKFYKERVKPKLKRK